MAGKHRKLSCTDGNCNPPPHPPPSPTKHVLSISPYIIIAVALLASFLLLLGYYLIIVRNCSGWQRRRRRSGQWLVGESEEFPDENPLIDHPVWYIRTIGLPQAVIGKIAIFEYKKGEDLINGADCSVCLNEFRDGENLRVLPKCNHPFHVTCIDTWLGSHTNCPLCRAAIISDTSSSATTSSTESIPAENRAENTGESNNNEVGRNQENEVNRIQQSDRGLRRSFSIDSSIAANVLGLGMDFSNSVFKNSRNQKMVMKRSVSYGGWSNSTSNSIVHL